MDPWLRVSTSHPRGSSLEAKSRSCRYPIDKNSGAIVTILKPTKGTVAEYFAATTSHVSRVTVEGLGGPAAFVDAAESDGYVYQSLAVQQSDAIVRVSFEDRTGRAPHATPKDLAGAYLSMFPAS